MSLGCQFYLNGIQLVRYKVQSIQKTKDACPLDEENILYFHELLLLYFIITFSVQSYAKWLRNVFVYWMVCMKTYEKIGVVKH